MNTQSTRRGYPLGALFVLVAASAVLIAGASPLARLAMGEDFDIARGLFAVAIGAGWGVLIGALSGWLTYRAFSAAGLGAVAGFFIGAASGAICLLPGHELAPVAAAMTAGSALIIGVALVMRRNET